MLWLELSAEVDFRPDLTRKDFFMQSPTWKRIARGWGTKSSALGEACRDAGINFEPLAFMTV